MIRDATPEELWKLWPVEGSDTWAAVLEKDGEIKGSVCLSREKDELLGHDMECSTDDPMDPLRLWRYAEKHARALGFEKVHVHIEPSTSKRIFDFWMGRGSKLVFSMFELPLKL